MTQIEIVFKRDGREAPFDKTKIADAIYKAAQVAGGEPRSVAEELAEAVVIFLEKDFNGQSPHIEQIQDLVEKVLMETGHVETARAYILYRERRSRIRDSLKVRKPAPLPDARQVRVSVGARDEVGAWDREKIVLALEVEADVPSELARKIAGAVEQRVLTSGMTQVSTSLIRELVDNELFSRGLATTLQKQALIGIPGFDLNEILHARRKVSHKVVADNPEAINLTVSQHILKQYALNEVFSDEGVDAHLSGVIHLHDLGYPNRIYLGSHSLEYLKKFGLVLETLDVASAPARHASTLTSQLSTFLGAMQSYAAGPQGLDYLNILYAPYLDGLSEEEILQEAQRLIFEGAQHAFSRGGQTTFADLNIYPAVPDNLRAIQAIGPGGQPAGRTYGEYEQTAQQFARCLLKVWKEGDQYGGLFCFPKCNFHVTAECFEDGEENDLLRFAAEVAAHNGVPVFVFDRADTPRLGPPLRQAERQEALVSRRYAALQSITINLPQAALRAGGNNLRETIREAERAVEIAVSAHEQKRRFVQRLSASSQSSLWQLARTVRDDRPYFDLENATCSIGLLGLNECIICATGLELHESDEAVEHGLDLVRRIYRQCLQLEHKKGIRLSLEETPAEDASRRLAVVDSKAFPMAKNFVRGDSGADEAYYTNGIKLRADAAVPFSARLNAESRFHPFIDIHALIQAALDTEGPDADEIYACIRHAFGRTEASQLAFTPTFTFCLDCRSTRRGLTDRCPKCDSTHTTGLSRIADYFSRTSDWNRSKLAELRSRTLYKALQ